MDPFENYTFKILPIWVGEELTEKLEETEDPEKQLRTYLNRAVQSLKAIAGAGDVKVTPERIAWFSIFSKALEVNVNALLALEHKSSYILQFLARVIAELSLQLLTIDEPNFQLLKWKQNASLSIDKGFKDHTRNEIRKRMCAYTA